MMNLGWHFNYIITEPEHIHGLHTYALHTYLYYIPSTMYIYHTTTYMHHIAGTYLLIRTHLLYTTKPYQKYMV